MRPLCLLNWLNANPTKRPQYWITFLDIPARINAVTNAGNYSGPIDRSVSFELSTNLMARPPFVMHLNMGASGTNDCIGYIKKLEYFGTNYSPGRVVISASRAGYGNTNYVIDNVRYVPY